MTEAQKQLETLLLAHLKNRVGSVIDTDFSDISGTALALIKLWKYAEENSTQKRVLRIIEEKRAFENAEKITILLER